MSLDFSLPRQTRPLVELKIRQWELLCPFPRESLLKTMSNLAQRVRLKLNMSVCCQDARGDEPPEESEMQRQLSVVRGILR